MSARSRERWRRLSLIGQLRMAQSVLNRVASEPYLSSYVRAEAGELHGEVTRLLRLTAKETTEPTELSAKKGT